ncbi:MAG: type I-C CRISPR-associated protein Cas5c [Verrucomicrobiales bacterium]
MKQSPTLRFRVSGDLAVFSRPELKVERMTYPIPTPSAMRGIVEAVFWKPAIRWRILAVHVLNPIRFASFLRNEVTKKAPAPSAALVSEGGSAPLYCADEDRAQRNTVALRDVDYLVEARFELTERAGVEENVTKFVKMFERRLEKGQHFHQPYLGCRECIAEVSPVESEPTAIRESSDFGLVLWDIEFSPTGNAPIFFHANMEDGIVTVPPNAKAARESVIQFAESQGGGHHA